ncbi:MAG: pilus assembly protein N-terminal domain-containing protein [Hyphomonas sp.]
MKTLFKLGAMAMAGAVIGLSAMADQFSVETNTTVPLRLKGKAASIVLGNSNIANVTVHDEHMLLISGKTYGTTNLLVFDADGRKIYDAELVVSVNSSNYVTINRAGQLRTFDCTPQCRPAMSIGDDPEHFGIMMEQQKKMQELAEGQ